MNIVSRAVLQRGVLRVLQQVVSVIETSVPSAGALRLDRTFSVDSASANALGGSR